VFALVALGVVFVGKTVLERRAWDEMMDDLNKPEVRFSPDFKFIVTRFDGGEVRLWDASSKRLIDVLGEDSLTPAPEFTSDGRFFALSYARYLMFYDALQGRMDGGPIAAKYWLYSVAVSPANDYVVATGSTVIELWNRVLPDAVHYEVAHLDGNADARDLAFSNDGTMLAAGLSNGGTRVWRLTIEGLGTNFKTAELFSVNAGNAGEAVQALAFSPDGRTLVIGDSMGLVRLVSTEDGRVIRQHQLPDGQLYLAFSGDSQLLAVGHMAPPDARPADFDFWDRFITEITVWHVGSGEQAWTIGLGSKALCDMAFTDDRARLTVGHCNGDVATHVSP
jgi:WD40 repeat protein